MVSNISTTISVGERQQLQRFLDRYGIPKNQTGSNNRLPVQALIESTKGISAADLQNFLKNQKNGDSVIPDSLKDTAYAKYLSDVFKNQQADSLNLTASQSQQDWANGVQIKLSELAQRILDLTNEMEDLGSDLKTEQGDKAGE